MKTLVMKSYDVEHRKGITVSRNDVLTEQRLGIDHFFSQKYPNIVLEGESVSISFRSAK
jgi:hypothetical protein